MDKATNMENKAAVKVLQESGFQVMYRKKLIENKYKPVTRYKELIKVACQVLDKAKGYRYIQQIDSDSEIIL